MRRGILALIAVGALLFGALALRGTIAPEAARPEVAATLGAWIGAPVDLTGAAEVRLLPTPRIVWLEPKLVETATGFVRAEAERLEASIAFAPLLAGRVEPTGLRAVAPRLRLDRPLPTFAALLAGGGDLPPIDLGIERGRIEIERDGSIEPVELAEASLAHGGVAAALDAAATARWRGETFHFSVTLPAAAPTARWSLAVDGAGLALKANGRRRDIAGALDGALSLDLADPPRVGALVRAGPLADLVRAPTRLDATLAVEPAGVTLSGLRLDLGPSTAQGSLALVTGGDEPALSGTLAFSDLTVAADKPIFGEGWKAVPLVAPGLALDLRLSAKRLIAPRFKLAHAAATLNLAGGRFNAELGDADLLGRPISVIAVGDLDAKGLSVDLRALAKDLPAADLGALFGVEGVEGGAVAAAFEGRMRCLALGGCVGAIDGRLRLSARALSITGASPFGDVTRFHPIVVSAKPSSRKTVWNEAEADVHLAGPTARIDAVELSGTDARFALKGSGDLADGSVDLGGHAFFRDQRAAGAPNGEIRIPLKVEGSIRKLTVTPAMPEQVPPTPPTPPLAPIPIVPPIAPPAR
ncbi:MAG: hypothetical protein LWW93_17255 [Hyphomicrobiales bacterium]|nr:hypothetical protein [Hyphomicrobiales bacterium]